MSLYDWLERPAFYGLKTRLFSFGRANVSHYLAYCDAFTGAHRVLDVGCGIGNHARLARGEYTGVDTNAQYIAYARQHQRESFQVMDASALAFPDASFDFTFSVGLYHHLDDETARAAAREMVRVTQPGGTAMIIDAVIPGWKNPLGQLLMAMDRGDHPRTLTSVENLLGPLGFYTELANIPGSFPYQRCVFTQRVGKKQLKK